MATISQSDFINSIAAGFQYISYYHPVDFVKSLAAAYEREKSPSARNAMAQLLINSRMAASGKRPICQDTGIATVFLKIGMEVKWDSLSSLEDMVNEGVRKAYLDQGNLLRASMVSDPLGSRTNTGDNTPAIIHTEIVPGQTVEVHLTAKGFGSENKSRLLMLNPGDNLVEAVLDQVQEMGAGWCPPGILGIGVGGSSEKAMSLAKESLFAPIDIHEVIRKGPVSSIEQTRLELYTRINQLGIGAQGLGGLTTVLDVKIKDHATHAAGLPVGIIPNCAATRHTHFTLDGTGEAVFTPPSICEYPKVEKDIDEDAKHVDLRQVTRKAMKSWRAGQTLLLTGTLITARDAAHRRLLQTVESTGEIPDEINLENKFLYYVGPVPKVGDEVIGSAGPTTARRMDKYSSFMLEKMGILGMIGKGERGQDTQELIRKHGAAYLVAVGGAGFLISQSIKSAKVVAYPDLGMEAVHEFEVKEMPVIVAVDPSGRSIHELGPKYWQEKLATTRG